MSEELYSRSPIHGFSFIRDSRSKHETVFWLLVMIIFLVVLSIDIGKLSKQYFGQETLSKVEMVNNEKMPPPPLIACFDVDIHTIIHILEVKKGFSIKDELSKYEDKEEFLRNLTVNSDPKVLATVSRYLAMINDHDSLPLKRLNSYKSIEKRHDHLYELENFLELEKKIEELNIDLIVLIKHYAQFIINTYVKKAILIQNSANGPVETELLSEDTTLYSVNLDGEACVRLDLPEFINRGPPSPLLELQVNYTNLHATVDNQSRYYEMYKRSVQLYILHHETHTRTTITQFQNPSDHLVGNIEASKSIDCSIEIAADYKSLSEEISKTLSCGSQSVDTCSELCVSEMIRYYCQCNPLFLKPNGKPMNKRCSYMKHYRDSCAIVANLSMELFPDFTKDCLNHCVPPCQLTIYIAKQQGLIYINEGEIKFFGTFAMFNYPKYQHVFAITWESFMGTFGGTLGIWFGASILSVIHLIFIVFDYFCKRKQVEPMIDLYHANSVSAPPMKY